MSELEELRDQAFIAKNRVAELELALSAAEQQLEELQDRLTLSDQERAVLDGQGNRFVPVDELRPIVARVFGQAAANGSSTFSGGAEPAT